MGRRGAAPAPGEGAGGGRPGSSSSPADTGQARAAFTRAAEVYESLGAAADVRRCRPSSAATGSGADRASRTGGRAAAGIASRRPSTTVAGLVEEGLSNPEIARRLETSPRTVATHVSTILKKLDVRTRADITRESVLRTIPRQR